MDDKILVVSFTSWWIIKIYNLVKKSSQEVTYFVYGLWR